MITELTPEQEELMFQVRDEWLDKIFSPAKRLKLNKELATKQINWLYEFSGLSKPKEIVFFNSYSGFLNVGASVGANVWANVGDSVRASVGANVGASVGANVGDRVRANVWDSVRANVGANVWDNVWANVGANVRANVRANVAHYGNIGDYVWVSYCQFFERIGLLQEKQFDSFREFVSLLDSGVYEMMQFKNICFVCPMPVKIERNNSGRLSSLSGHAIEWEDGWGQNYINGIFFGEEDYNKLVKDGEIQLEGFKGIKNQEQRMAILSVIGGDGLAKLLNATLIKTEWKEIMTLNDKLGIIKKDIPFELYRSKGYGDFVIYECPSTGRRYHKFSEKKVSDPVEVIASAFGQTVKQYLETVQS